MTKQVISDETKEQITLQLDEFVKNTADGSQNMAAKRLNQVSGATISNMRSKKWTSISDDLWRSVQKQTAPPSDNEWKYVPTRTNRQLAFLTIEAAETFNVFAVIASEGRGKTETTIQNKQPNVFSVECGEHYSTKILLREICRKMGIDSSNFTIYDLISDITKHLYRLENPVIFFDEIDKLSDPVLYFLISFMNQVKNSCGILFMATSYFKKRMDNGVDKNKKGYREFFSRCGGKFIILQEPEEKDLEAIIRANGIHDELKITGIINESTQDIRRVRRLVQAHNRKKAKAKLNA